MNVLKPHLKATIRTLLGKGISHRQINRTTGIDRKTIRKYDRLDSLLSSQGDFPPKSPTTQEVATGLENESSQNPPPWPPAPAVKKLPKHARSSCEPHREWIEEQVRLGNSCRTKSTYWKSMK